MRKQAVSLSDIPMDVPGPVSGAVISEFQTMFGLSMKQLCEILSIPRAQVKNLLASDEPVKDPSLAILVRFYMKFPQCLPRKNKVDMREVYQEIGGERTVRDRAFCIPFGRDAGGSYRWLKKGLRPSGCPMDLALLIAKVPNGYGELFEFARAEAIARGVNPFLTGSWSASVPPEANAAYFTMADLAKPLPRGRAARKPNSIGIGPGAKLEKPVRKLRSSAAVAKVQAVATEDKPKAAAKSRRVPKVAEKKTSTEAVKPKRLPARKKKAAA